uniref:30S ribosomal protein S6, chloroplastic n=1 Tax=Dicranema revolutum TaxID=239144 RepID=A0A4D6WUN6_9FLOR|nr:ribosomal protein S6 [Dicranema revolutum]
MKLNYYETTCILKPDIKTDKHSDLINEFKNLIKKNGAKNILIQHKGRKHLSYNINHYYDGIYIQVNYKGNGNIVKNLHNTMKLNNNIIRYLTVKQNTQDKV